MTPVGGVSLARITVVTPTRRIDVALPEDVPLAELLRDLLVHAGESAADDGERHGGWVLRKSTGAVLESGRPLNAQGVRDGDVLHLAPARTEWPELEYDDVVEAIASGARRYGRSWGVAATRRCGLAVTAAVFEVGLVPVLLSGSSWLLPGIAALVMAAILTGAGIVLARALSDARAGAVVAGCGLPYAFVGGFIVAGPEGKGLTGFGAPHVFLGSAVLLLFGIIGYVVIGVLARIFSAGIAVGLLGVLAGLLGLSAMPPTAGPASVAVTVAIGLLPGYPLLSIRLGKLPVPELPQQPEDILKDTPVPPKQEVFDAVARSDEILAGLLLGVSGVGIAGSVALLVAGGAAARVLVGVAAFALLLRARLFPTPRHRIPMLVGGITLLAMLTMGFVVTSSSNPAKVVVLLVVAVIGMFVLLASLLYSKRPPSPYLGRFADIADVLAIITLIPTTCIVAGFFDYVQDALSSMI